MIRSKLTMLVASAALLAACGSPIETDGLEPITDYSTWERRVDAVGPVGGHGDSYRIMYANDIVESYAGSGLYPVGSVVVKEIRAIDSGETPGDLRYLAIMRKLEEAPPGGELDSGWLFTRANDIDSEETNNARCWQTCHQAAPLDGTFLDWSFDRR